MPRKVKAIGINHVAIEVDDIDKGIEFYCKFFELEPFQKTDEYVYLYMGDQYIALVKGRTQGPDDWRHFAIVVEEKEEVRRAMIEAGVEPLDRDLFYFLDPWGNCVEVVTYADSQFLKAPAVLNWMGVTELGKSEKWRARLTERGLLEPS